MGKQSRLRRERKAASLGAKLDSAALMSVFCVAAPPIFKQELAANSCLNAVRILIDVCDAFGLDAEPVSVDAVAMNAKQWELLGRSNGVFPQDEVTLAEWVKLGAYSVRTHRDTPAPPGTWPGHLVAVVDKLVVDPSARQLTRESRDLLVDDVVIFDVKDHDLFKDGNKAIAGVNRHGSYVSYRAVAGDESFRPVAGFARTSHNMDIARRVILSMDPILPPDWKARSRAKRRD